MDRGSWMNVLKTQNFLILIDFLARDFFGNNFAKNAVRVVARMLHRQASYLN
jgi:hypothetical protein